MTWSRGEPNEVGLAAYEAPRHRLPPKALNFLFASLRNTDGVYGGLGSSASCGRF